MPASLFAELPELTQLFIHDNPSGASLPNGLLASTHKLRIFSWTLGGLRSVPAGFFRGLTALEEIDLSSNVLSTLPKGIFSGLPRLHTIDLNKNAFANLPPRVFAGLPALRSVDVGDSYAKPPFSRLPHAAFEGLTAPLEKLKLDGVSLQVSLHAAGPGRFRAVAPAGAPFDIVLPVTATNGTIAAGATTLTIAAGALDSAVLEVTRTAGTAAAVTVEIGTLPSLPDGHSGYQLVKPASPLTVIAASGAPAVTLALSASRIAEADGVATVTASLAAPAAAAIELTVAATPVSPATHADFRLSAARVLTIASGATASSGTVTVTALDNRRYTGDRTVEVAAAVSAGSAALPALRTLTIEEDEPAPPPVELVVAPESISEAGGSAQVTATLAGDPLGAPLTLTVTATPVAPAGTGDFTQTGSALTIAAGQTRSTGTVRITAVNNDTAAPDNTVRVTAAVAGASFGAAPQAQVLTIADDEATPVVTLQLSDLTIDEGGGIATVTATLAPASGVATTVRVTAQPVAPAGADDFTQQGTTLTFLAGTAASTGAVRITAGDDDAHQPDKELTVRGVARNDWGVTDPSALVLTIREDDAPPTVTLRFSANPIGERGSAAVTAALNRPTSAALTLEVSAAAVAPALATDFTQSATALTIAAGAMQSTGTVTIAGVNDGVFAGTKQIRVTAEVAGSADVAQPAPATLTIEDDEPGPSLALVLSPDSVGEEVESATVTATLEPPLSEPITITVVATPVAPATDADYTFTANRVLTIAAGQTRSAGTVTITTVGNAVASSPKTVHVTGQVTGPRGLVPESRSLTIADDEAVPAATLVLSASAIGEDGGSTGVTATLDALSGEDTTLLVAATPVAPARAGDFGQQGATLTIPAGTKESAGEVTVTALDNDVDAPDRTVTVAARITGGHATAPAPRSLTIEDDELTPRLQLLLSPAPISENGGVSRVTARLAHPSSELTTVTVAAAPGVDATANDFTLSANRVLTIAAGARESTGTVTIAAADDEVYRPDRSLTVTATARNTHGVIDPAGRTLAIEEDEQGPAATLHLSASAIDEDGGTVRVTATLDRALGRATTYAVAAAPVAPALHHGEVTLSANRTLTIAAGETASTGTVTITALENDVDAPDTTVRVSAAVSGFTGLQAPAPLEFTIRDDDDGPGVRLERSAPVIGEAGDSATVTASLTHPSSADTTVRVSAAPVAPAAREDFRQAGTLLMVPAGQTASSGGVTITAVDNDLDAPDRTLTVTATAVNSRGLAGPPAPVTITVTDDEAAPAVRLVLNPPSVAEDGGVSRVTALLDHPSVAVTTVTVATAPPAAEWYTQSGSTLTIAAGARASTGTVRVTANDGDRYEPGRTVTVTGEAANDHGMTGPAARTLAIDEDEPAPTARLLLSADAIAEDGGAATVTASLDHALHVATTYTVAVTRLAPAVPGDAGLGANRVLTIAAGATESTGTVRITAVADDVDAPDRTVRVTATVGGLAMPPPAPLTLTIRDDDAAPAVTLALSKTAIGERRERTAVTATLAHPSSADTTVRVAVAPVAPAVQSDFRQDGTTLTIPAGATESTGQVTVRSVDNAVDAPDRTVQVAGTVRNRHGVAGDPPPVTLTIRDDDAAPVVRLALHPPAITENGGASRVTAWLDHPSSAQTTVTVSTTAVGSSEDGYFRPSSQTRLTIAAGARASTGTVRITAVNDSVYGRQRAVTVGGAASNTQGISGPSARTLTILEDEPVPVVTLLLSSVDEDPRRVTIGEDGGVATVTVAIDRVFDRDTTYTVIAAPVAPALAADFMLDLDPVLTIAAGAKTSSRTVTVTAVDNDTDAPDKEVRLTAEVGGFAGVARPVAETLAILDDEDAPSVTLALSESTLDERGGVSALTAALDHPSSEDTTLLVAVYPDAPALEGDLRLSSPTLTIPAGVRASAGQVVVTAVDNDVDAPDKSLKVGAAAHNLQGVAGDPEALPVVVADDETAPAVSLVLSPAAIVENGGKSSVTARLDHPSSAATTVSVATDPAAADWFTRGGTTLTIAAGRLASAGAVRINAVDNDVDADDRTVSVTGTAANTQGVAGDPPAQTLTVEDDEKAPTVRLDLSDRYIVESGGASTVTARLNHASNVLTTLSIAAQPAPATWYTQSGTALTIAAGQLASTGTVRINAVDDDADGPNRTVTLAATVTAGKARPERQPAALTIADDEGTPTVWLDLAAGSIPEGGSTTISAGMSAPSSGSVSMRIAYDRRFGLSDFPVLRIPAGQTVSSASVTITAPDDAVHGPGLNVPVRTTLFSAAGGIVAPDAVTLTITDDEAAPAVTLELSETDIVENGGETTVTARLDRVSSADTTITVITEAVATGEFAAADYFVQRGTALTIPAGSLWSRGRVRVTTLDNPVDGTGRTVTVTGTAQNDGGVTAPADLTLTISDDDPTPTVTLALSPDTVSENLEQVSTVTASLSAPSGKAVLLTVASRLIDGRTGHHTQTGTTLTIPAGQTASTGQVTITPVNDRSEEPDKTVAVSAAASGGNGVAAPASQHLTIVDDDDYPRITLHVLHSRIQEGVYIAERDGEKIATYIWAEISHPWHSPLVLRIIIASDD